MRISVIRNREQFERIREAWSAAHAADPEATVFVSWEWMRGWLESTPFEGFVLAAREEERSPYTAFLPLGGEIVRKGGEEIRKLVLGGMPWSDNTGFVCTPGSEHRALPAFADFVQNHLKWDFFDMRNVSDRRLDLFLSRFSPEGFSVRELAGTACPHILLPDSWERYLREFLGPCTRKHLKYYMKKAERLSGFRAVHTGEDNLEHQIDTLLALWQVRWGDASGAVLNTYRALFRSCAAAGSLCLTTLWGGGAPFAA
ncbi:MAG: GNAT family N-acetyltransferase, partial [Nitrospirales bacterium]|nr:GNAT family N-acetyltransferase [Nitrospirales bacterium]